MYTLVPFNRRRDLGHMMENSLFDDRFFRSFFDVSDWMGNAGFRVDVKETDNAYALEAELPGVKQENVSLTLDQDVLTIAADMNTEKKEEKANYLYSERRTGHMERRFNLEGIDQDCITARFENGMLMVNLPKAQPQKPKEARRISIGE
ncbi:MAG: Hsp20/alpha crystallin family protein [Clostridia bacterium]|nr:Hsp20/alpha crystallin family protein [Clostridia bacterium]